MRENIANVVDDSDPYDKMSEIKQLFQSYLNEENIEIGLANLLFIDLVNNDSANMSLTGELDIRKVISSEIGEGAVYIAMPLLEIKQ